jgi:hypothetical protein
MEPDLLGLNDSSFGRVMKRLIVLGVLAFGIVGFGLANGSGQGNNGGQGQNGNSQGQNGNSGNPVPMPEGPAFELPYFLLAAASWGLWRYSRNRKHIDSTKA